MKHTGRVLFVRKKQIYNLERLDRTVWKASSSGCQDEKVYIQMQKEPDSYPIPSVLIGYTRTDALNAYSVVL